jgi:hypothetical protein
MNYVQNIFNDKYKNKLNCLISKYSSEADKLNELKWLNRHITNYGSLKTVDNCLDYIASKNSDYIDDIISRLKTVAFKDWLATISEVLLASYMHYTISNDIVLQPKIGNNVPEFLINIRGSRIFGEVKTIIDVPKFDSQPFDVSNTPDLANKIRDDIKVAIGQFQKNEQNILFIVDWKFSNFAINGIKNAIWGSKGVRGLLIPDLGKVKDIQFSRDKKKAKLRDQSCTRISAICSVHGNIYQLGVDLEKVIHNPYAKHPIDGSIFANFDQEFPTVQEIKNSQE